MHTHQDMWLGEPCRAMHTHQVFGEAGLQRLGAIGTFSSELWVVSRRVWGMLQF